MSCAEATGGFCLKSGRGVYDAFPPTPAAPSPLLNRLFMLHDVKTRHAMISRAMKAMQAPTTMKTKFSGRFVFCM